VSELFGDGPEVTNQPSVDPESAGATDQGSRLTNSARTLALGAILSGRSRALDGIQQDVQQLGVPLTLGRPTSWDERQEALAQSDEVLRQVGADELFERETARRLSIASRSTLPRYANQRVQLWEQLRGGGYEAIPLAYAWLRLILNEDDPLLAVSGSAALSHWQRPSKMPEEQVPRVLRKARTDVATLIEDTDPLVSAIAQAATGVQSRTAARISARPSPRSDHRLPEEDASLLVHGTFAYADDWWYPGGEFHGYIKTHVRSNLYDHGDPFLWSGRYKVKDRRVAAARLADWLDAKGMMGLDCVLAHSYGGAVAFNPRCMACAWTPQYSSAPQSMTTKWSGAISGEPSRFGSTATSCFSQPEASSASPRTSRNTGWTVGSFGTGCLMRQALGLPTIGRQSSASDACTWLLE
jgi:hypothetical protein